MSHCYSVGVEIEGKNQDVCTIVPGNDDLAKHVKEMESSGGKPRAPTPEEVDNAIRYHIQNHKESDHETEQLDPELDDMLKE